MQLTREQITMAIIVVAVLVAVYYVFTHSKESAVGGLGAFMTPEQKRQVQEAADKARIAAQASANAAKAQAVADQTAQAAKKAQEIADRAAKVAGKAQSAVSRAVEGMEGKSQSEANVPQWMRGLNAKIEQCHKNPNSEWCRTHYREAARRYVSYHHR